MPVEQSSPTLIVAHLQRPMLIDGSELWQQHIDWVKRSCDSSNVIAAGDFNATLANLGSDRLGSCVDVNATLGRHESGTWPASLPSSLGAQIDRVLAGEDSLPTWFGVLEAPETRWAEASDHRPIFAILTRR